MEPLRVVTREEEWRKDVQRSVIETIEEVLEMAKSGEIDGIAFAATLKTGDTFSNWSRRNQTPLLNGAIAILQHRLITSSSQ